MNKNRRIFLKKIPNIFTIALLIPIFSGCAMIGSVTQKNESKFETTGLFIKPCKERTDLEKSDRKGKNGFWSKFRSSKEDRAKELNATLNCNEVDLTKMIEAFGGIKESDEEKGASGDSIDDVKTKGFTIYLDDKGKTQRPSTEILYGADALAAAGMPLNPPQLNTPEAIETYKKYMKSHFAWTFQETNIEGISDRIYINTRNASTTGPSYKFVIIFKDNHVFRRVIKGGPQNTITQEKAFLLGPGGFIGDLITGGVNRGFSIIK